MVARFRLFEIRTKDAKGDVFTLVDAQAKVHNDKKYFDYRGFDHNPTHPQGIGMSGEFTHATWAGLCAENCKNLGTRIGIEDVEDEKLKAWILGIVKEWGGRADALIRGRNSLKARAERKAAKKAHG